MRQFARYFLLFLWVYALNACSPKTGGYTTTVVKPKYHKGFFDRKTDKRKKRTKTVRMRN